MFTKNLEDGLKVTSRVFHVTYEDKLYHALNIINMNRDIKPSKVNKLMKSISDNNALHLRPILVDTDYNIIDGQTRYKAAKALGLPIEIHLIDKSDWNYKDLITINTTTSITFDRTLLLHNLGFHTYVIDKFTIDSAKPAETHPSINIGTYLDIVVDEIPYNACKHNPRGLNIIHRLPLRTDGDSSIVYYKSNFIDHNYQHLFPPMNLSHLTVHLYMDGQELPLENLTISFEFELVILNK